MITREKKLFLVHNDSTVYCYRGQNFHEDRNQVKLQWFLLTIVAFSKTNSNKIPPGTFF